MLAACEEIQADPVISLVFPQKGGGTSQVFLHWAQGKTLRDYVRDPLLRNLLSIRTLTHGRVTDQTNRTLRSTHVPKPNDEIRIMRVRAGGA